MTSTKWLVCSTAAALVAFAHIRPAAGASSFDFSTSGNICVAEAGSEGLITQSQYGVQNVSAQVAVARCPIGYLNGGFGLKPMGSGSYAYCGGDASGAFKVTVYDRSATDDVVCTLSDLTADGYVYRSWTQRSSGFGSASQTLTFGSVFGFWGFLDMNTVLTCSIPAYYPGIGWSHVTSLGTHGCVE